MPDGSKPDTAGVSGRILVRNSTTSADSGASIQRLKRANESLLATFSLIPEVIEIVGADGTVAYANAASQTLRGRNVQGASYGDFMGLNGNDVVAEALTRNTLKYTTVETQPGERLGVTAIPTLLSDGQPAAVVISKLAESEKQVAFARNLAAVMDATAEGIMAIGERGQTLQTNRALRESLGYIGETPTIDKLFAEWRYRSAAEFVTEFMEKAPVDGLGCDLLKSDGSVLPVAMRVRRCTEQDGSRRLIIAFTDRSEVAAVESQMQKALKLTALGERLTHLTHEVNNHLSVSTHHTRKVLEKTNLDQEARDWLSLSYERQLQAEVAIRMVAALIKPDAPAAVNINALLRAVIEKHLSWEIQQAAVKVTWDLDTYMPLTKGFASMLEHAFINIVRNAICAVRDQNERVIHIATEATPATIEVRIADNGPGIANHLREKIFELMFTTKGEEEGTGVGLHFTRDVILRHRGTITAENPDAGALFKLRLPVRESDFSNDPITDPVPELTSADRKRTGSILVIDDDEGVRDVIAELLLDLGHGVTLVESAREALTILKDLSFDVIISDIHMPDFDGYELSRKLQEEQPRSFDRLVFITGDVFAAHSLGLRSEMSRPMLEKPFNRERVHATVQDVLARHS